MWFPMPSRVTATYYVGVIYQVPGEFISASPGIRTVTTVGVRLFIYITVYCVPCQLFCGNVCLFVCLFDFFLTLLRKYLHIAVQIGILKRHI